jgi:hypothetical protein
MRYICEDSGQIMRIPNDDLYRGIHSRPNVWIYEGRNNGWWYYDYDMQDLLENAWNADDRPVFLDWYICGQKVHIDFFNMQQTNCNAVRAIRRLNHKEIDGLLIKGVAGMMPK